MNIYYISMAFTCQSHLSKKWFKGNDLEKLEGSKDILAVIYIVLLLNWEANLIFTLIVGIARR